MRTFVFAAVSALAVTTAAHAAGPPQSDAQIAARVAKVLKETPLIDGHNDLPEQVRDRWAGKTGAFDLRADLSNAPMAPGSRSSLMTDLPRLKAGQVGGQFWSVFIPGNVTG